jgi:hypothetical protein
MKLKLVAEKLSTQSINKKQNISKLDENKKFYIPFK